MATAGISKSLWERPLSSWWASSRAPGIGAAVKGRLVAYCWWRLFLDCLDRLRGLRRLTYGRHGLLNGDYIMKFGIATPTGCSVP